MARLIEGLIVFSLALNLWSGMLVVSGAADDAGIAGLVETGGDENVETAKQEAGEVSTGAPTGSTLFGMYNVLANTLGTLRAVVFGAPAMLYNLGTPSYITTPMEIVFGVVYSLGIIKFLRGI